MPLPRNTGPWAGRMGLTLCIPVAILLLAGCEEETTEPELPPTPVITSVAPTTVSVGDTVTVTGRDFAGDLTDNTVRFATSTGEVKPFAGSTTQLSVVVPANAATGPLSAAVAGNPESGVGPVVEVTRAVGEVWVFGGTGSSNPLKLPHPSASAEYLIVPHATNASAPISSRFAYTITANEAAAFPAPALAKLPAERPARALGIREEFDQFLRENDAGLMAELGPQSAARREAARVSGAPPQFRNFSVLSTFSGNFTQITAEFRYETPTCQVYADVDTHLIAAENLSAADYKNFGDEFHNSIRPINTNAFGVESDVDGNGQVIILMTPVVNRLTPQNSNGFVGGFFLSNDLFSPPQVPASTTNEAEIFYLIAADPAGVYSVPHSVASVASGNLSTIAHEYEHLISFSHRLFNEGGVTQRTWLEEGMAHMAEDLNGLVQANIGRGNRYLADPGGVSLEDDNATLEQRGGIFLFLRYLADRFGDGILKSIVQSTCSGRACIETVTGENFYQTFADFLATLYLSGRGINTSNKYNFQSIDLADFDPLPVTSRFVGDPAVTGDVVRTGGDHFLYRNTTTAANEFIFSASSSARLRVVVVRTQ